MEWKDALQNLRAGMDPAPEPQPDPTPQRPAEISLHKLKIAYERKGRGGKEATILYGFPDTATDDDIARFASQLKKRLGCGGSARGREVLLQGDVRQRLNNL